MESVVHKIVARIPRELAMHLQKEDMEVALSGDLTDDDLDSLQNILYYRSLADTSCEGQCTGVRPSAPMPLLQILQNRREFSEQISGIDSEEVRRSMIFEMKPMSVQNRHNPRIQKKYSEMKSSNDMKSLAKSMKNMKFDEI